MKSRLLTQLTRLSYMMHIIVLKQRQTINQIMWLHISSFLYFDMSNAQIYLNYLLIIISKTNCMSIWTIYLYRKQSSLLPLAMNLNPLLLSSTKHPFLVKWTCTRPLSTIYPIKLDFSWLWAHVTHQPRNSHFRMYICQHAQPMLCVIIVDVKFTA